MFDNLQFLLLSEIMMEQASDESTYRTIINRAYYAVHLQMKESLGISGLGQSIHQDVIKELMNHDKSEKIGKHLRVLFESRKKADYNMNVIINKYDAKSSISLAKYILDQYRNISENNE